MPQPLPDQARTPRAILLTNIMLTRRTGTEVVTGQLADGLRRRGHDVMVFTPQAGPLAMQMRARGHVVVTDPAALPRRPDIIHAHHIGPAMAALAAHPGVPAIFVSHDATAPFDAAPPHPAIRRIFAVDERCRARLVADGVPTEAVGLLPNAVDLSRIPPRAAPLPVRPTRAVVLAKQGAHLPAIRDACAAAGIAVEEFGRGPGRMTDAPEALFATADLVFATARAALEAAAAGAGVIVCDARGCAGFLTRARAEAWLPWNLGAGILANPAAPGPIAAAIAEWSAGEAASASALIRAERNLEALLDRIEAIHAEVLAAGDTVDPAQAAAAMGAFIAGWVPSFDLQAPWRPLAIAVGGAAPAPPAAEILPGQVATLSEQVTRLAAQHSAVAPMLEALRAELSVVAARSQAIAARGEAIEALLHRGPLRRLRDGAAAVWRAVVPRAIRAPLNRWRRGRPAP
ncbi:glycosyltransferase family 4 protein [Roseomonas sp. CAU 1739]|uniref:glycosyltransferase family 4 protein n=1 Tax=Roseomonas sp. CAU 1739 TaxID=3140364 RepID=UPI00325C2118